MKHSLLIVEDSKPNLVALTNILSSEYRLYISKDGQDAVKVAAEHLPDVILLDIVMPKMDGYEVITQLKASEATKNIPVIFITGLNFVDAEEKGLNLGAADYITKPFSGAIVKLRVRNQIKMVEQLRTIERLSMIDQLTGIPNRRSFDMRFQQEWARAVREKTPLSILAADIDMFKDYNDDYGHHQGDTALRLVGDAISKSLMRSVDFVARWGGEEFFVLLPNTDSNGAAEVAEKMRAAVEILQIPHNDGTCSTLTVSVGTHTQIPSPSMEAKDFIIGGDRALYTAKKNGRNQVCIYEELS